MAAALVVPAVASAQDGFAIEVACGLGTDVVPLSAAAISPFATLSINGVQADFSRCIRVEGKVATLAARFFSSVANGTVQAEMNADPFINYALATTNLVPGPVTFAFLFGTPIVPGFYNSATSSVSGSLTAGQVPAGVANSGIAPTFLTGYGTVGLVQSDLGVPVGNGPCATAASTNCPAAAQNNANGFALTFYDNLEALHTYDQTGVQSQVTASGRVDLFVTAVPEPATVTLVAAGALLLGIGAARRRPS